MTNPIMGFWGTLGLFLSRNIFFDKEFIGKHIRIDGKDFEIFRKVQIKNRSNAKAYFIVRFKPIHMTVEENIIFSKLPMMIFMGFSGFVSKYWAVNRSTGICQGFYEWETEKDAIEYSKSIAMKFMIKRSDPKRIEYRIINKEKEKIEYSIL